MPTSPTERKTATEKKTTTENTPNTLNTRGTRGRKKIVDETMRNTILHEREVSGLTQEEIAAMVGISPKTVGRVLLEHAISTGNTRIPRIKWKPADKSIRNIILHEHNVNGLKQKEIAAMMDISRKTVGRILKKHILSTGSTRIPCSKGKPVDDNMRKIVLHQYNANGLTQREIAAMVGTSKSTIGRILMEYSPNTKKTRKSPRKMKPIDEAMRNTILHESNVNGISIKNVAAMVGTSRATVSRILKAYRENEYLKSIRDKEEQNNRESRVGDSSQIELQSIPEIEGIMHDHDPASLEALLLLHAGVGN